MSVAGDSGSLWYHRNSGAAVGLHFAGESTPGAADECALACNVKKVTERLNVRLATLQDIAEKPKPVSQPEYRRDIDVGSTMPTWAEYKATMTNPMDPDGPTFPSWPLPPRGAWRRPSLAEPLCRKCVSEAPWPLIRKRNWWDFGTPSGFEDPRFDYTGADQEAMADFLCKDLP